MSTPTVIENEAKCQEHVLQSQISLFSVWVYDLLYNPDHIISLSLPQLPYVKYVKMSIYGTMCV